MAGKITGQKRLEYFKLLELHNDNRIDYNVRKWETLKYSQGIVLAFIGGTIVALTTGLDRGLFCKTILFSAIFTAAVTALPLIAFYAAKFGIDNLRRETDLLFAEEAECFKLAKLLGLDRKLSIEERWIPGDDQLLMPKWRKWHRKGVPDDPAIGFDEWVKARTSAQEFRKMSDRLFKGEKLLAFALLGCLFFVFLASQFHILGCYCAPISN